jgi:hypothetical protein
MMRSQLRSRRLGPVILAILGLTVLGAGGGQASDVFVAGSRSTRSLAAPADDLARAQERARAVSAALGLPGVGQRVERRHDAFEHRTYDEVASLDAAGRTVAITRLDLDGTVGMAVALGWHPASGPAVDGPGATARATALARAAGLSPAGQPLVRASAGAGGWSISWPRIVDGVVVRGDGLRIALWPDGAFHGLTRTERPLAAAPDRRIAAGDARRIALDLVRNVAGASAADLRVVAAEQAWIAPNDTFGGPRLDAPADTLRLAWAVRLDAAGPLADRLRSIEIWLDAGDGGLLGGDVVE